MITAVIDTGVFVAGVFWRHEPHLCLKAWLRGILRPVMTEEIMTEYETVLERLKREQNFHTETAPWLKAVRGSCLWTTPIALGRKVCRDAKDDKFIEAALAAGARTVIARDQDLTVLQKPFGIVVQTPRAWLATLTRSQRRALD